jgi:hypothetical protein
MNIVPRRNTPVSARDALRAVGDSYAAELGRRATSTALALILALVWVETARGRSVQNFNLGNITASEAYSGDAWRPPWFEPASDADQRTIRLHEAMERGEAPRAFRAYSSLDQGARDFVRSLRRDFPDVLASAELGDPDAFRVELSRKYSKDYEDPASTASIAQFQTEFAALLPPDPAGGVVTSSSSSGTAVRIVVALAAAAAAGGALYWFVLREPPVKPARKAAA